MIKTRICETQAELVAIDRQHSIQSKRRINCFKNRPGRVLQCRQSNILIFLPTLMYW
jgi:hypothetical protein